MTFMVNMYHMEAKLSRKKKTKTYGSFFKKINLNLFSSTKSLQSTLVFALISVDPLTPVTLKHEIFNIL